MLVDFLFQKFTLFTDVCIGEGMHMPWSTWEAQSTTGRSRFSPSTMWVRGSNPFQAWWQGPLPTEPFCQPQAPALWKEKKYSISSSTSFLLFYIILLKLIQIDSPDETFVTPISTKGKRKKYYSRFYRTNNIHHQLLNFIVVMQKQEDDK